MKQTNFIKADKSIQAEIILDEMLTTQQHINFKGTQSSSPMTTPIRSAAAAIPHQTSLTPRNTFIPFEPYRGP